MTSIIHTFFENPVLFCDSAQTNLESSPSSSQSSSQSESKNKFLVHKCKTYGKNIKAQTGVTSNLIAHINTQKHENIKNEWKRVETKTRFKFFGHSLIFYFYSIKIQIYSKRHQEK